MSVYPPLSDYRQWLDLSPAGTKQDAGAFLTQLAKVLHWTDRDRYAIFGTPKATLRQLGVKPGDYVLLPNLSPLYWAEAVKAAGSDCILIDHDPGHWQLDLDLLEEFLMNYTMLNERDELILKKDSRVIRTLILPHLLGGMCDMDRLGFISMRFQLPWGEDISQALGSSWKDQAAGSFGTVSYLDFSTNPILPFGTPILFSDQKELLEKEEIILQPMSALANQLGKQLVAKVPAILEQFRKLEKSYHRAEQQQQLQWMELQSENRGNGLSAAFTGRQHTFAETFPTGRLQPPVYQEIPFDKSLYIRREDWSARLFREVRLLPIRFEDDGSFEKLPGLLSQA